MKADADTEKGLKLYMTIFKAFYPPLGCLFYSRSSTYLERPLANRDIPLLGVRHAKAEKYPGFTIRQLTLSSLCATG